MFFQVAYPTFTVNGSTGEGGEEVEVPYWPSTVTMLDGHLGGDLFTNHMLAARLKTQHMFKYIDVRPNRRAWSQTPLAINAFYSARANGLWIPAGMLQAPFIDSAHSDARNYGSIGCILAHEMSHAFDDEGSRFDATGDLHPWWHPNTTAGFAERKQCLEQLYSSFVVDGRNVSGKLTIGEDIADTAGVKLSYEAFASKAPRTPQEKRTFFTAFAQTWCADVRSETRVKALLTDPHAPQKYRVIGALSQFAPFGEAYGCPAGSPMAPRDRCSLW